MANRCLEEFNPWPSFVDIFSSVILVLLLFLLIAFVNIGYYAQFKFKVQYTGTVVTDDIILTDTTNEIKQEVTKKFKVKKLIPKPVPTFEQEVKQQIKVMTDIENPGEDLSDKVKQESESRQTLVKTDRFFYISFEKDEIFVDQNVVEKLKEWVKDVRKKYNFSVMFYIYAKDAKKVISLTVTKQQSVGRVLGIKTLLKKFKLTKKDFKINLTKKIDVPDDIEQENGVVVIEAVKQ